MSEKYKQVFYTESLQNGITVLGEEMDGVSSAAVSFLVPTGAAYDPENASGCCAILSEMFNKGAGSYNSLELSEEFERIGASRNISSGVEVSVFSSAMLADNLLRVIELFGLMLLSPCFPQDELESVRQLALQDLKALEDEPSSKVMSELARVFYPYPFGRSHLGTEKGILSVSLQDLKEFYGKTFLPDGLIIAVAGKFVWKDVLAKIKEIFCHWQGKKEWLKMSDLSKTNKSHHIQKDTAQLQIALAFPSVTMNSVDYYPLRVAVNVLSGGMSGRLFVEVREKRGLVYRVSATHSASRHRAAVIASAGTTPENGEETLQIMLKEIFKVGEGVTERELLSAKADLKSRLVMQSEISSSRASSLVHDWWNLNYLRKTEEIKQSIDRVCSDDIVTCFARNNVAPITLVTLGAKELELKL